MDGDPVVKKALDGCLEHVPLALHDVFVGVTMQVGPRRLSQPIRSPHRGENAVGFPSVARPTRKVGQLVLKI